jgi:hypothetical protein
MIRAVCSRHSCRDSYGDVAAACRTGENTSAAARTSAVAHTRQRAAGTVAEINNCVCSRPTATLWIQFRPVSSGQNSCSRRGCRDN